MRRKLFFSPSKPEALQVSLGKTCECRPYKKPHSIRQAGRASRPWKSCVHDPRKTVCEPRHWWLEHQAKVTQMSCSGSAQDVCRLLKSPQKTRRKQIRSLWVGWRLLSRGHLGSDFQRDLPAALGSQLEQSQVYLWHLWASAGESGVLGRRQKHWLPPQPPSHLRR